MHQGLNQRETCYFTESLQSPALLWQLKREDQQITTGPPTARPPRSRPKRVWDAVVLTTHGRLALRRLGLILGLAGRVTTSDYRFGSPPLEGMSTLPCTAVFRPTALARVARECTVLNPVWLSCPLPRLQGCPDHPVHRSD